jgi:hypothetical protein
MRSVCFGWVVFCALFVTQGCRTPSPDWNGTWKLDPVRSNFKGQVLTISSLADGGYRFDEGSSRTLRCDGTDQPIGNNGTLVCVKSGDTALDIIHRENGVKTRATRYELSSDGKVLTTTVTEFRPNGPVIASVITFSRLSGSNGFAGQWWGTSYLQQHADMTLSLDNQALHIHYPSTGQHIDAPLDGVQAVVRGPNVPEGTTYAVRLAGQREFLALTKRNGKVLIQGSLDLSGDGRVIIDSLWYPDNPDAKTTLVYQRMGP